MKNFIQNIVDEIIDQYMFADETKRPWIIGFSGGKDSTVMLQQDKSMSALIENGQTWLIPSLKIRSEIAT